MRGGHHTIPLRIVPDGPLVDGDNVKQEWLRDVGMSYDPTTHAYDEMSPKRTTMTWTCLKIENSLLVVRYPDMELLGDDCDADEASSPGRACSAYPELVGL